MCPSLKYDQPGLAKMRVRNVIGFGSCVSFLAPVCPSGPLVCQHHDVHAVWQEGARMTIYIHDTAWADSEAVPVQVAPKWDMKRLHREVVVGCMHTRPLTHSVGTHTRKPQPPTCS